MLHCLEDVLDDPPRRVHWDCSRLVDPRFDEDRVPFFVDELVVVVGPFDIYPAVKLANYVKVEEGGEDEPDSQVSPTK